MIYIIYLAAALSCTKYVVRNSQTVFSGLESPSREVVGLVFHLWEKAILNGLGNSFL